MKHYAAIDIGGSAIKFALMKEDGSFVEKGSVPTPKEGIQELISVVTSIVKNYENKMKIEGIALSIPGAVNIETGVIGGFSALPYIHGPNIKQLLFESTGLRIELENDANCAGLCEAWIGAAKSVNDFICIVIGSGIGGVIVLNKKVRRGKNSYAGEFGSMLMKDYTEDSLRIGFRRLVSKTIRKILGKTIDDSFGQPWNQLASTTSFVQAVTKRKGLALESLNGKTVFDLLNKGDKVVKEEFDKFVKYLAVGILNLANIIDPEKILIGGAISESGELINRINEELTAMRGKYGILDISVERCAFENDSNLIGALWHFRSMVEREGNKSLKPAN
ncbi:ROK family protein [Bacillus sp. AFS041924]|uniref:ROK family protein n=1 Tax=Bacillus sp. AFS041924 TaxID=2033503 RepID=UPI000BFDC498|nr:ROK family protein [Bacillus sp. AFS041924]PGS55378.1 sugar kinase [Bacillus sp. AFS041924]